MSLSRRQPEATPVFYVLDFDRCLLDTDRLHRVLETVVAHETPIDSRELAKAKRDDEEAGKTFDSYEYVRAALAAHGLVAKWAELEGQFIAEAKYHDLLMPGAHGLLGLLRKKGLPFGIVTYGIEAWQLAKLEASGLVTIPHEVTQIKEKGTLMRGWQQADGTFHVPAELGGPIADSIIFLDDKAISFTGIPHGVRGVRILPVDQPLLPAQVGPLPPGVTEVKGLIGAIELLFGGDR